MPVQQKVLVDPAFLKNDVHGAIACEDCHGGDPAGTLRSTAHVGLVRDPTWPDAQKVCGGCHADTVTTTRDSLHNTLRGIRHAVEVRAGGVLGTALDGAWKNHCSSCHASCGQCHVSSPKLAGGGLLDGHRLVKTPPMTLTCSGCHGSRVDQEYQGKNVGTPADVHRNADMVCTDCHTRDEMHGVGQGTATHRYQVPNAPKCVGCHAADAAYQAVAAHQHHLDELGQAKLSCQVCHAGSYKQCYDCHVTVDDAGQAVYEVNAPSHLGPVGTHVGRNPMRDGRHPEYWVTVRHFPAAPDGYAYYGDGLLPAFDARPTWNLATPHTIVLDTPQAADCTASCHGKRALFVGPADLKDYEVTANAAVVVETAPGP